MCNSVTYPILRRMLRASPVALHLHPHPCFIICDADADAGTTPNHPGIREPWKNCFAGDAELPAFRQVMQRACYQLKTKKIVDKGVGFDK